MRDYYEDDFGIWSCKFSADGNEVIAGGSSMIFGPCISIYEHYREYLHLDRQCTTFSRISALSGFKRIQTMSTAAVGPTLRLGTYWSARQMTRSSRFGKNPFPPLRARDSSTLGIDGRSVLHPNHQAYSSATRRVSHTSRQKVTAAM